MNNQTRFSKIVLLVIATLLPVGFFALLLKAPEIRVQEQAFAGSVSIPEWHMLSPDPNSWVTTTQPIAILVQVTNTEGVKSVSPFADLQRGLNNDLILLNVTIVNTQSMIIEIPSITLSEGTANIITYTIYYTSSSQPTLQDKVFSLKQDSVPPTGSILYPRSSITWTHDAIISVTWAITDPIFSNAASGLTKTVVWFYLKPDSPPVPITRTADMSITWMVSTTDSSNQASIHLQLSDNAGNQNEISSELFAVNPTTRTYTYLPAISNRYPCDNQAADWCEPNNTITTAFKLALNYPIIASINMTTDRYDYYRVSLNVVRPYTATLTPVQPNPCPDSSPCDIDLYLREVVAPFTYRAISNGPGASEQFVFTPSITSTGDYVVLVYAANSYSLTQYSLIVK